MRCWLGPSEPLGSQWREGEESEDEVDETQVSASAIGHGRPPRLGFTDVSGAARITGSRWRSL
jgi:hypothetical protein